MEKVKQAVHAAVDKVKPSHYQTVLVTGASSYIGAHVLEAFLKKGYKVRGVVRSESSAANVRNSHATHADNLTFTIVQDITVPGAFDEAVKGVDGVIHLASPFVFEVEDFEKDLLHPAINGTLRVLESIQKCNPHVKRVVMTSSFAAIVDIPKGTWPEHTYTEADWNPCTYDEAKEGPGAVAYCASKKFAEQAAFEFVEKNKSPFTVASICPPMVYGPTAHTVESLDKLNTSSADIYRLINGSEKTVPDTAFWAYADVRDVAEAHLRAYEKPELGNQRYLCTGGNFSYQQICDIIRANFPQLKEKTPEGTPNQPLPPVYKVDASKAKKDLGMEFTPLEKTIKDAVANFLELEKATTIV